MKISNNISFNGYKNVVSYDISNDTKKFAFFSAELTDDQNSKDLTVYRYLLKKYNLPESKTISCFLTQFKNQDFIFFNQKPVPNDFILKDMKDLFSAQEYSKKEGLALKTYSFLAHLTKRMSKKNINFIDSNNKKVIQDLIFIMENYFKIDSSVIYGLVFQSTTENRQIGRCASIVNASIQRIMTKFFQ